MLGRNINSNTLSGINRDNVNQQLIETIQEEILIIETDIDSLKQEQTVQNQNIAANAQNINLNSIDIDDLESEQVIQNNAILANTNAISQNTTSINTLQGQLNGFQTDTLQELNEITADLTALQNTVSQNKTTADNEFSDIQQQLVDLDVRITQNRQDIDQNFLYIEIIMTSIYYNKSEIDAQFLQLRGTWTGSISELKDGLDSLIDGLTVRMGQAEADITGLQSRMTTEEQQTAQQWTAISDLQSFDTNLQNQINSNDGDISTLENKTQHVTSNSTTTIIDSDLVVDKNIVCDKLTCTGTIPENPALFITDEAGSAIMSFDSLALNAQGNPIVQAGDGRIIAGNTGETGVLTLSTNSTTRAGIRITKDQTTIAADTLNIRNSADSLLYQISSAGTVINSPTEIVGDTFTLTNGGPDFNPMTTVTKATSTSAILAQHGNIHTNSIRFRSVIGGLAIVGSANSSYTSITPLISSMTNFTPTSPTFFVVNPGFKLETYSGTNYGGSQNVFNNGSGNFSITEAAIGSVQSIKLFFRNMNGSETQILL